MLNLLHNIYHSEPRIFTLYFLMCFFIMLGTKELKERRIVNEETDKLYRNEQCITAKLKEEKGKNNSFLPFSFL